MTKCNEVYCRIHSADSLNAHFLSIVVGRWPQMAAALRSMFTDKYSVLLAQQEPEVGEDTIRTMILDAAMDMTVTFADEVELHLQNPEQFAWYASGETLLAVLKSREQPGKKLNLGEDKILNTFTKIMIDVMQATDEELMRARLEEALTGGGLAAMLEGLTERGMRPAKRTTH